MAQKKYIALIDYIKAFAIIVVTTTHFFGDNQKNFPLFSYVIQMGMPLFMLLGGYNTAMSNVRHGRETLSELYTARHLRVQLATILPSYTLMFAIEAVATGALGEGLSLWDWVYAYISGGLHGGQHGGYFFCVYWQFCSSGRCSFTS